MADLRYWQADANPVQVGASEVLSHPCRSQFVYRSQLLAISVLKEGKP
jgi:hypothetical protein